MGSNLKLFGRLGLRQLDQMVQNTIRGQTLNCSLEESGSESNGRYVGNVRKYLVINNTRDWLAKLR